MSRNALVVGINTYDTLKPLKASSEDAEAIARILSGSGDFTVYRLPEINNDDQSDDKALYPLRVGRKTKITFTQLEDALIRLFKPDGNSVPETALFYFSGHGLRKNKGIQEGFLATSDVNIKGNYWGLSLKWLRELLQESPVKQQVIWLDCCYSGELLNFDEAQPSADKHRDYSFIAASREYEVAYEEVVGNHGVLTRVLLQGLDPTRLPDQVVSNYDLVDFIQQRFRGASQCPIFANSGGQILLTGRGIDSTILPAIGGVCPYKGLNFFDYKGDDPKYFYGRTALTDKLIEKVQETNFLAILGASGSGKSSVMRAGLLYQLQLGQRLSGSDQWSIHILRPGKHPLNSLAEAFIPSELSAIDWATQKAKAKDLVDMGVAGLTNLINGSARNSRVVLAIDQFEEVFTLCESESERKSFFNCLLGTIEQVGSKLCLILSMRTDFWSKCNDYPKLAQQIDEHHIPVLPITDKNELKQVIIEPAKQLKAEVEQDLVSEIIADVEGPGSLPLLQYTLTELWENRVVNRLTLAQYSRLGRIKGTLPKRANEVYQAFSPEEKLVAKRIFLELTQLGEGTEDTRRQVSKSELVTTRQSAALIDQVMQRLSDARLIVVSTLKSRSDTDEQLTVVDVAHEVLIRHWSELQQWLQEYRDAIRIERRIEAIAHEWMTTGKPAHDLGVLLQGSKLLEAEDFFRKDELGLLSPLAQELIRASRQECDRLEVEQNREEQEKLEKQALLNTAKQRNQILLGALGIAGIVILGSVGFAWAKASDANISQQGTQLEQAGVSALRQFKSGELNALVSAMQGAQKLQNLIHNVQDPKDYPAVSPILALQKILDEIHEQNHFDGEQQEIRSALFLPDGKHIATAGKDGTIRIRNFTGEEEVRLVGHKGGVLGGVNALSVSADAQNPLIASAGEDGTVRLWNQSGKPLKLLLNSKQNSSFTAIFVSRDGQKIAAAQRDGTVFLWERSGKQLAQFVAHTGEVNDITFSLNGQTLATAGDDGVVRLWSVSGSKMSEFKSPEIRQMFGVSLSPNGKLVATASDDNRARIWTISGQEQRRLEGHNGWVMRVRFSPDGQRLVTASDDGTVRLWNLSGRVLHEFSGHRGVIWSANFSSDGQHLVTAGRDQIVRLWNLSEQAVRQLTGFQDDVNAIAFSPDGKSIAGAGNEGIMRLWDLSGKELKVWTEAIQRKGGNTNVQTIAFSPDGKWLVVAGLGVNIARVWDLAGSSTEPQIRLKGNEEKQEAHQAQLSSVAVSPDSQLIATGSYDKTIRIWKPKSPNGELVAVTVFQEDVVSRVRFTPNSQQIVSGTWDGNVGIWSLAGQSVRKWKGHQSKIQGLDFTPDGKILVTADASSNIKIWDFSGNLQQEFFSYQSGINDLRVSPNGQIIVTGGMDGTVKLWDFQGRQIAEFKVQEGAVWGVNFSPDGKLLTAGADQGIARIWHLRRNQELMTQGCKWLRDYLDSHSDEKEALRICQ